MQAKPTVFVVDDDAAIRDSLRWLIESVNLPVETYASAAEFLDAVDLKSPGCLILDVRMPGTSGLDLQDELGRRASVVPVILLTGHADVPMAVRAMKAGAFDFIEKPFNDQLLLDRVQDALADSLRRCSEMGSRETRLARLERLTPREREVLERVIAGKQNKVIARELGIGLKTVEVHRHNVMEKMEAQSLADLIHMLQDMQIPSTGKP